MKICNCLLDISAFLCDIPQEWKDGITKALCYVVSTEDDDTSCTPVKNCETVTSLSAFTKVGSVLSFTYKNENGVEQTRSFNIRDAFEGILDGVDPNCITDEDEWDEMSLIQKLQSLLDGKCNCCTTTTTTLGLTFWEATRVECIGNECFIQNSPVYIVSFPISYSPTGGNIHLPVTPDGFAYYLKAETSFSEDAISLDETPIDCLTEFCCICKTYEIDNQTGSGVSIPYNDCDATPQVIMVADGDTVQICACEGSIVAPDTDGLTITELEEGCNTTTTTSSTTSTTTTAAPTTTTTSSTTTTTTTAAPTTTTTTSTSTTTTTTTTVAPLNNVRVENTSLDITFDSIKLDGVEVPPGTYATPGNNANYTLATDGLVDIHVDWVAAITGQHVEIYDTNGAFVTCESIEGGDPNPFFDIIGVDMTGPSPLLFKIMDGPCL